VRASRLPWVARTNSPVASWSWTQKPRQPISTHVLASRRSVTSPTIYAVSGRLESATCNGEVRGRWEIFRRGWGFFRQDRLHQKAHGGTFMHYSLRVPAMCLRLRL
jgi:hypothetical protein